VGGYTPLQLMASPKHTPGRQNMLAVSQKENGRQRQRRKLFSFWLASVTKQIPIS